jgi:hypothetical protein
MTSDASRIAEHRLKKTGKRRSREGKKEKAFCNVMRYERIKKEEEDENDVK